MDFLCNFWFEYNDIYLTETLLVNCNKLNYFFSDFSAILFTIYGRIVFGQSILNLILMCLSLNEKTF